MVIMFVVNVRTVSDDDVENAIDSAGLFFLVWGVMIVVGIASLIWQAFLRRVPLEMWLVSALLMVVSTTAAAINFIASLVLTFHAVYG